MLSRGYRLENKSLKRKREEDNPYDMSISASEKVMGPLFMISDKRTIVFTRFVISAKPVSQIATKPHRHVYTHQKLFC